jgi:HlyD family secretion protein
LLNLACSNSNNGKPIEATGTLESKYVTLSARSSGEIKGLSLEEGDNVRQGDTLVIIDPENAAIQVRNAEAALALMQAQYTLLVNGSRKEDIQMAEAQLNQAKISYDNAKTDKERYERLFAAATVTKRQLEDIEEKYDLAEQQLKSAKENNRKVNNLARPEELQQAKARVEQATATVDAAKKQLRDAYITSPISGTVVKKYVERGESVSMLSNLLKLTDQSIMELMLYVSETELGRVKLGADVDVSIDSFKGKIYKGKVVFISPDAEFTPKNIQTKDERTKLVFGVKVDIPNPGFELKAGLPADAIIR